MKLEIPYIEVEQPIGTFYLSAINAKTLVDIVEIRRRNSDNIFELSLFERYTNTQEQGVQRAQSKERVNKIKDYCWYISKTGYVISQDSEHKAIRMHRLVMNVTDSKVLIDHIYHNKTDNRKSQLRIVSASQNGMNTVRRKDNTSGVTGVSLDNNRWLAQITCDGKLIRLGRFNTFDEAVSARKLAEEKYFGEYAYTE